MADLAQTRRIPFWERMEGHFERFVHRTRTDSYCLSVPGLWRQIAVYFLEVLICGDRFTKKALAAYPGKPKTEGALAAITPGEFLVAHGITYDFVTGSVDAIPKTGPVIIVANHPYGVVEAVMVFDVILKVRKDVLVMANYSFASNPLASPYIAPIDFRETPQAVITNKQSMRRFANHMKAGGVGIITPSGMVATRFDLSKPAQEGDWHTSAAKYAMTYNATVLPGYVEGEPTKLFHLASKLGMVFRLAVMMRENYLLRHRHLRAAFGPAITPEKLNSFPSRVEATRYMREQTDALRDLVQSTPPGKTA